MGRSVVHKISSTGDKNPLILHITPLCSLLHMYLKAKCMGLQAE